MIARQATFRGKNIGMRSLLAMAKAKNSRNQGALMVQQKRIFEQDSPI
jgi:hypothetical protein